MKKYILALLTVVIVLLVLVSPHTFAQSAKDAISCGANTVAGGNCNADPANSTSIGTLTKKIINILSVLTGAIAVIMIIVAGFRFVTSAGSDSGVQAAKKTITYAVIGLVIVVLAQIIVHFVINAIVPSADSNTNGPNYSQRG